METHKPAWATTHRWINETSPLCGVFVVYSNNPAPPPHPSAKILYGRWSENPTLAAVLSLLPHEEVRGDYICYEDITEEEFFSMVEGPLIIDVQQLCSTRS